MLERDRNGKQKKQLWFKTLMKLLNERDVSLATSEKKYCLNSVLMTYYQERHISVSKNQFYTKKICCKNRNKYALKIKSIVYNF